MTDLFSSLLSNVWAIFLVIVFFGGSIFVHELGHFLAARRRGVHVERFSIGFGPPIVKWRRGGVEYRLSWFPLGGYVLLPQLADLGPIEGESATDVSKLPPVNYTTKMLVFVAGAAFNIFFAFLLACIVSVIGQPTLSELNTTRIGALAPTIELPDGTKVASPAVEAGIQAGDTVVAIDGNSVTNFEDIISGIFLGKGRTDDGRRTSTFTIDRAGKKLELTVYPRLVGDERVRTAGIEPAEDLTIAELSSPEAPAAIAGLKKDDRVVAIDGTPVFQKRAVIEYVGKRAGQSILFTIERDGRTINLPITPKVETDRETKRQVVRIGIAFRSSVIVIHPNPFTQIKDNVVGTFRLLDALISPSSDIGPSKLSGPIGIARELHRQAQWDFRRVLWFTILLNVSLAIFNLLPIPVLDGGQMLFATIARLRGKPLPVNFIVATQSVFMVLFLMMFVYVTVYGDIRRLVRDFRADRAEMIAPAK